MMLGYYFSIKIAHIESYSDLAKPVYRIDSTKYLPIVA